MFNIKSLIGGLFVRKPKLTLMMMVKNEADRFLKEVLDEASQYVDEIVILDDGSTDGTVELCKSYSKVVLLEVFDRNKGSFLQNESVPRKYLWDMVVSTNPEWILALDADEVMDNQFKNGVRHLIETAGENKWFAFTFYHFWGDKQHYRTDKLWNPASNTMGVRLVKYTPGFVYQWKETELHCGSIPNNIFSAYRGSKTPYRVKHYGYVDVDTYGKKKYEFYVSKDPVGQLCPRSHLDSILDEEVKLAKWVD